jgi:hypothetical protein
MPFVFYFIWLCVYGLVNFVLAADLIKRRNYDSTYNYMKQKPAIKKILDKVGTRLAPIAFLIGHAVFWFVCHLVAMVQFQFFWINLCIMIYWLYIAVWNGSCYYMDYFARKYEM